MKTLIVYYSFGGNTRKIARMLQDRIGGDLAEIETAVPYTGDYNAVVAQGEKEIQEGYMPELKPLVHLRPGGKDLPPRNVLGRKGRVALRHQRRLDRPHLPGCGSRLSRRGGEARPQPAVRRPHHDHP